jgi:hypothetical protein
VNTNGALAADLSEAQREFSEFAKEDPCYRRLLPLILEAISANPGMLQTDMYRMLGDHPRTDISYVLYFAAEHGRLVRRKKGRTYCLYEQSSSVR